LRLLGSCPNPRQAPKKDCINLAWLRRAHSALAAGAALGYLNPAMPSANEAELKLLIKALAFSARKHRDQRRKDVEASPYINHPIALADLLVNEGHVTDIEVICGALLHDTLEDTDTTLDELLAEFGPAVTAIVAEVTDDKHLPPAERKRLQILDAPRISDKAKLVKLADKIANLRDMADSPPVGWPLERRQAYFDWAKAVVDKLRGVHPLLEEVFDAAYARRPS
jgi:guanosine-3',5'-bis(diphosphate) 3'-pyrophosphohydrolase